MLKRMLNKTIKDIKYEKLVLETDKTQKRGNLGTAWISTKDVLTLKQLIKLHYHVSDLFIPLILCFSFHLGLCLI